MHCESKKPAEDLPIEDIDDRDDCLHFDLYEIKEESRTIDDLPIRQLRELEGGPDQKDIVSTMI